MSRSENARCTCLMGRGLHSLECVAAKGALGEYDDETPCTGCAKRRVENFELQARVNRLREINALLADESARLKAEIASLDVALKGESEEVARLSKQNARLSLDNEALAEHNGWMEEECREYGALEATLSAGKENLTHGKDFQDDLTREQKATDNKEGGEEK